ncbi:hypothetical protein JCM14244_01160 [Venenivibrio stagnispumantis]|uniref:Uncharacterized protein n=1 Tax=Venenivibrio stagnispumantis TaxID=407998 RepID=A0AA45WKE2_9AQUI|nr:hypothetical protein [Venenivibrio stagnispumantis]MCW4573497.1 hypothetical protein [Venenivibrio stagnispumantis]SMP06598.1 hypothetical protein SAMN06264868_10458 [Venenivibrio stagnispumantis]
MNEFSFEEISKIFQEFFRIDTISHCDILKLDGNNILLIEETVYINKNLLDNNIYNNEVVEIVKKMWGTHSILVWYLEPDTFRKKKIFILKAKVDPRFSKILGKLNREIRRFKNGAYSDIKFII